MVMMKPHKPGAHTVITPTKRLLRNGVTVQQRTPAETQRLQELNNKHHNQRGFLIGGGSSLKILQENGFNFKKKLQNEIVVGVNKAYELVLPTYLVFGDTYFWKNFKDEVLTLPCVKFAPQDIVRGTDDPLLLKVKRGVRNSPFLPEGLDAAISFVNNSGVAALRMMYCLGCNPIYLLGIDLREGVGGHTHFHTAYKDKAKTGGTIYKNFRAEFVRTLTALKERNVSVYSCSPISSLNETVLSFIPITEVV
jgi:hypothetical protein